MTEFVGARIVRYPDVTIRLTWLGPKDRPEKFERMAEARVGFSSRILGHLFQFDGTWYVSQTGATSARSLDTFGQLREYLGLADRAVA